MRLSVKKPWPSTTAVSVGLTSRCLVGENFAKFRPLGQLCVRVYCGPWRGIPGAWRKNAYTCEGHRRVSACAASAARSGGQPRRTNAPFSLLHLAPTLLDCLQAPLPAEFTGRSYWQQIKTGQDWNDDVVVECIAGCRNPSRKKDRQGARLLAVREERYKLIFDFQHRSDQLFDLQTDPGESCPLHRDTAKPVRRRLLERAHKHIAQALDSQAVDQHLVLALRSLMLEPVEEA